MQKILLTAGLLLGGSFFYASNGQYCTTGLYDPAWNCTDGDDIDDFSLGVFSHLGTGCSGTNGYNDFTSQTIQVTQSVPQILQVTSNYAFGGESIKLFIDYNSDQDFDDPGEEVYVSPATFGGPNALVDTLIFPPTSPAGTFRLRAKLVFTSVASVITPCSNHTFGETHDYTITILPNTSGNCAGVFANFSIDSISGTAAKADWVPGAGNSSFFFEYGPTGFTPGTGTSLSGTYPGSQPPVILTGLSPQTTYDYYFGEICNSGADSVYFNLVQQFTTTKLCASPTGFTASNLTSGSTDLSWNQAGSIQEHWIFYGPTGFNPATGGSIDTATSSPYTLSGLSPVSNYDIYIATNCAGGNGISDTIGPINIATPIQGPQGVTCTTAPGPVRIFVNDFEQQFGWTGDIGTGASDGLWNYNSGATNSGSTGPDNAHSGNQYIYFEASGAGPASLISPAIDLTSVVDAAELSFWMHAYGADIGFLRVMVSSTSATGPFTDTIFNYATGQLQTAAIDPWQQVGADLSAYVGQTIWVEFQADRNSSFTGDIAIDLMEVTSCGNICVSPSALKLDSITGTSAWLDWTENGFASQWDIEFGTAGFTPSGTPTYSGITAKPYLISSLNPASSYEFYVRAACGGTPGNSSWIGPFNFSTLIQGPQSVTCNPATDSSTFLLEEDFDSQGGWTGAIGTGATNGMWNFNSGTTLSSNTGPSGAQSGNNYIYFEASGAGPASLISPAINLTYAVDEAELAFWLHAYGEHVGYLNIAVSTTSAQGPFTDTVFHYTGQIQTASNDPWQQVGIDLDNYLGQTIWLRFQADRTTSFRGDIALDLITIEACGTFCLPEVYSIDSLVADFNSAVLHLDTGNYQIEWGPCGYTQGTGTFASGSAPLNLTGLSPNTCYDVYVRRSCGPNGFSGWGGPFTFGTPCVHNCVFTADLYDTFGDGWNGAEITFYQNGRAVTTIGSSFTTGSSALNIPIQLCDSSQTFVVLTDAGSFPTEIGFDITSPYSTLEASHTAGPASTGETLAVFTTSCVAPTCPAPTSLSFSNPDLTSVDISWTTGGASGWQIEYGSVGFSPGSGTIVSAPTNPFTLTGLTASTSYDVYIRDSCGPVDMSFWSGPLKVSTSICAASETCVYIADLYDTFGDGWNGAEISFVQNGIILQTIGSAFTTGSSFPGVSVSLCDSLPTYVILSDPGNWPGEIEFDISSPYSTLEASHVAASISSGDTLAVFTVICTPPSCPAPTGITSSNSTMTNVDISWTTGGASNWQLEYGPIGFTPGTGTLVNANSNPFTLTGLTAATAYDVYVRDSCGVADVSSWIGPLKVSTQLCSAAQSCNYTADLFDTFGDGWNGAEITFIQNGISVQTIGSAFTTGSSYTGVNLNLCDNFTTYVVLSEEGSWPGEIEFDIYTPYSTLAAAHTAGSVSTGDTLAVFLASCVQPTCPVPSNLSASNPSATSIDLSWTTGGATNWQVEYGPVGYTPGTGSIVNVFTNPYTLSGLNSATSYDIYVRDSCGMGDVSAWIGPVSMITANAGACNSPINFNAVVEACDSIILTWNNAADSALIAYGQAGSPPGSFAWVTSDSTHVLTGTLPNTTYNFYISNVCNGDTSTPALVQNINTGNTGAPSISVNYVVNGFAVTLNALGTTGDGNSYTWNYGDGSSGSGILTNHTYPGGNYTVTLTVSNNCGTADTTFTIAGINLTELEFGGKVSIFPNPTSHMLSLELILDEPGDVRVKLMSVEGKLIAQRDYGHELIIHDQFDLSHIADGIYFMQIEMDKGSVNRRIIKE